MGTSFTISLGVTTPDGVWVGFKAGWNSEKLGADRNIDNVEKIKEKNGGHLSNQMTSVEAFNYKKQKKGS